MGTEVKYPVPFSLAGGDLRALVRADLIAFVICGWAGSSEVGLELEKSQVVTQ